MEKSDDDDEPGMAVVDELVEWLPKVNDRPYLAAFVVTHPDQDHCRGFTRLLNEVDICELWFTPRVCREYKNDLCDVAQKFKKEAERRVKRTIEVNGDPGAGDRVRVFGYSELLAEDFDDFPEDRLTVPGKGTRRDRREGSARRCIRAFVHAPFKDDDSGERNDTSLGMQITLYDGTEELRALLLGDLSYPIIKRIFEVSDAGDSWPGMFCSHHITVQRPLCIGRAMRMTKRSSCGTS